MNRLDAELLPMAEGLVLRIEPPARVVLVPLQLLVHGLQQELRNETDSISPRSFALRKVLRRRTSSVTLPTLRQASSKMDIIPL